MKKLLLALIRFYQKYVSPAFPPRCRFMPTCSQYAAQAGLHYALFAAQAIEKYGALKGGRLALKRLLRCHPFHRGDYDFFDPVP